MRLIFLLILLIGNTLTIAQENKFSAITLDYGYHMPRGEISNTFGNNSSVGINFIKAKSNNIFYGLKANYLFSENINDSSLFNNINTESGYVIDGSGSFANIILLEKGFSSHIYVGYSFHNKENKDQGLYISSGIGFLQHKIFIDTKNQYIPQLDSQYKKGYDQLTNGISTQINIDYIFMGKNSNLQFFTGLEYTLAFTKNKRNYNLSNMQNTSENLRYDQLMGLKIGLIIPISRKNTEEFHYF
ncbi:MAG: hypothetical protein ACKVLD_03495 [Flavobacteriales bacterium]|jgi:hypothetical protein|nr:hypothetical protein [Flavobacteriales bacterium]|tara:strand:- start:8106 stop:8837 length:732 start_codon:yes stop_codon:yes gene_type:complete